MKKKKKEKNKIYLVKVSNEQIHYILGKDILTVIQDSSDLINDITSVLPGKMIASQPFPTILFCNHNRTDKCILYFSMFDQSISYLYITFVYNKIRQGLKCVKSFTPEKNIHLPDSYSLPLFKKTLILVGTNSMRPTCRPDHSS